MPTHCGWIAILGKAGESSSALFVAAGGEESVWREVEFIGAFRSDRDIDGIALGQNDGGRGPY